MDNFCKYCGVNFKEEIFCLCDEDHGINKELLEKINERKRNLLQTEKMPEVIILQTPLYSKQIIFYEAKL